MRSGTLYPAMRSATKVRSSSSAGGGALGYRREAQMRDVRDAKVDDPALLDGAAGPPLVLLAAATDTDPGWDRALLLS
jgi:hypothetical protein